jgi:isoquinoline 1-oxidoreductase alpha subunit
MANELTLSVNGAKQVVSAGPETPLLFVLRNELKLTGPRLGCGMAQCGACSVLLDVQQAWIDEQVPQCGYCQSGMMIVAVQLLAKNPNPTVAQIKDAFTNTPPSPHLCRCGTYTAIIDAVQRAATAMRAGKQAPR